MKKTSADLTLRRRKRGLTFRKLKSALGWSLFFGLLVVALAALIVWRRADVALARVVDRVLAEQFPELEVSSGSARLDATRGLQLYSVEWRRPDSNKSAVPLLHVDEIYVDCPLEVNKLLAGKYEPRRIVISHPVLTVGGGLAQLQNDLAKLLPAVPTDCAASMSVEINDASMNFGGTTISGINARLAPAENDLETLRNATKPHTESDLDAEEDVDSNGAPEPANERVPVEPVSSNVGFVSYQPVVLDDPQRILSAAAHTAAQDVSEPIPPELDDPRDLPNDSIVDRAVWNVEITASNPFVEKLAASGKIANSAWEIVGRVENLDLATFLPLVRSLAPQKLKAIDGVQGKTSFDFNIGDDSDSIASIRTRVDGALANAALSSSLLKYPLSEISAEYSIANDLLEFRKVIASCGQTSIRAAFRQAGVSGAERSATIRAQFDNLPTTDASLVKLVKEIQSASATPAGALDDFLNVIDDYRFSGHSNFDVTLEKSAATNGEWAPRNISVEGQNIEFLCVKFPYRLDGLDGRVTLDEEGTLSIALESRPDAPTVKVQGRFVKCLSDPCGQVDIVVENRAIDSLVFDAMEEESRKTLRALHPSGAVDARVRIAYDPDRIPIEDRFQIEADVTLRDGAIQYEYFPMPISSISGSIYMRDGAWVLSNLSGKSGSATFAASGSLVSGAGYAALGRAFAAANANALENRLSRPDDDALGLDLLDAPSPAPIEHFTTIPAVAGAPLPDDGWRFLLASSATKFPLGEEFRAALVQQSARENLERLRLEGKADMQFRVGYRTDEQKLAVLLDALPIPESTSIHPEGFPFALTNVEGKVFWREGALTIEGFRARNGSTIYSANIRSQEVADVGRVVDVSDLRIDQLQIDRDLQSVTQSGFLDVLNFLQPKGFFNVDGALRLIRGLDRDSQYRLAWDLRFFAQQNSLRPGVEIEGICGRARTWGVAVENAAPLVYGELDVDTLFCKDAQFTKLCGPFYYNGSDVFWGRRAPAIRRTPVYGDPFIRERVDSDPFYQTTSRANSGPVLRAQRAETPPGFVNEPGIANSSGASFTQSAQTPFQTGTDVSVRPVQANVFGGLAICDGIFLSGAAPQYSLTTSLQNATLDETIRVFSPGAKPLKGRVGVRATLQGEGRNIAALKGEGAVNVREAQLYELPQIVRILQILSVQAPNENAFSSCDVDFKVLGDHLELSRVLLEGEALTLFGNGWLTVRAQERLIDLTLSARLGISKTQIPVLSDLLGAASDQVSQIRVEGDLASPVIQQERLPGLKKAWWSIFPEQEPAPTDKAPVERNRPFRDAWRKITGSESYGEK